MSFTSLNHILGALEKQARWQEQPLPRLLKCWCETVGVVVAAHTRPISIQRNVLWVATSSAVWAQELSFGRQRILDKINPQLPSPLLDIRFSPAQWQRSQNTSLSIKKPTTGLWREHPSCIVNQPRIPQSSKTANLDNPNTAFQHWAEVIQARSQGLPLCPQCQCPTPPGELQRWTICSICAAKKW